MSLILDALRKSEAERRRGQSPDLFAPTAAAPVRDGARPRTWPLLLLGAMLFGSAWLIWDSGDDARVARERGPLAGEAPTAAPPPDAGRVGEGPHAAAPAAPVAVLPPPAPEAPVQQAASSESARVADSAPAPSPASSTARATMPTPPVEAIEPTVPEALPPHPGEALPPVSALDAATRASLPVLKLSMHVYADEPSRRFAIVDGQRIGEGAVLGSGRVAHIRRDGLVIEVNGRRVLLPKP